MFSKQVYKWNSVDIWNGENGIYHTRGIVVDRTETGLMVDFDIAKKEPKLVSFDRIIQDDELIETLDTIFGSNSQLNYEVLLQLSAEEPWTWYPAEKLADSGGSFVLVRAKVADGHSISDVVRRRQVRDCPKHRRAVLFHDYLKEHVSLPDDDFVVTPLFRQLWIAKNYLARTYPVGIVNKKFYYMQRRYDAVLDPSTVLNDIEEIVRGSAAHRGVKRSHEDCVEGNIQSSSIDTKTELAFSRIPFDLLHGVLSHLDAVELARYRRVCPLWDSVICSTDFTKVVIYDTSTYQMRDVYVLANVLFKLIKKTTMYLIITGRSKELMKVSSGSWFRETMQIAKMMLDQTGITTPTLVLADLELCNSDFLEQSYASGDGTTVLSKNFPSICQRLVLVRVSLLDLFEATDFTFMMEIFIPEGNLEIPYASIRTNSTSIARWDVRDALEPFAKQFMKPLERVAVERVGDWIKEASKVVLKKGIPNLEYQRRTIEILRTWEADDRRFGPECTWKDVERAQLNNKLDTLHSITLMCLLYKMEDPRFEIPQFGEDDGEEESAAEEDSDASGSVDQDSSDESLILLG